MLLTLLIIHALVLSTLGISADEWTVDEWWQQNIDYHNPVAPLRLAVPQPSQLYHLGKHRKPAKISSKGIPMITESSFKNVILKFFNRQRTATRVNTDEFSKLKTELIHYINDLGLTVAEQPFWPPESGSNDLGGGKKRHTSNLIITIPSDKRGKPGDEILVLGGHYDTVKNAPGVDDNGAGSAAVLEMARLVTESRCRFNKTLMFVLFDMEEDGLKGSKHFIKDYLLPTEVHKNGAKISGAIITDMILEYDPRPGAQLYTGSGDWNQELPDWVREQKERGSKADFMAIWARDKWDTWIYEALDRNWLNKDIYKLSLMAGKLPLLGEELDKNPVSGYRNIRRSDHASFWYPTQRNVSIPAILLHDLAPWRQRTANTYHTVRDDVTLLRDENVAFAASTVNSVLHTVFDLAGGRCG